MVAIANETAVKNAVEFYSRSRYTKGKLSLIHILLPVGTIDEDTAAEVIPEMDSTVLVYCRSGNRSKTASSVSYTHLYHLYLSVLCTAEPTFSLSIR